MTDVRWAILVACLAGLYVAMSPHVFPSYRSDFDQLWLAARAWRSGADPYAAVLSDHRSRGIGFGLLYPFTAVVCVLPLSFLPLAVARVLVATTGAGLLTYFALGRAWWLFPLMLSGAFRSAVSLVQVAPFVACAVIVPAFGWVAAFKPNVGIAAWCAGRREALFPFGIAVMILVVAGFLLWPSWVPHWRAALGTADYTRPLALRPFGWLLLLAAIRWRRPEARWLLATALLPGTPAVYDALPLLVLLPQSFRQALVFAILTHVADLGAYAVPHAATMRGVTDARAMMIIGTVYLPALALILVRRSGRSRASQAMTLDA